MTGVRSTTMGQLFGLALVLSASFVGCNDASDVPFGSSTNTTTNTTTNTATNTATIVTDLATVAATNVTLTPSPSTTCQYPANYSSGNGSLTWYLFSQGSAEVNCSYLITTRDPDSVEYLATGAGQYFAAMNTADYNTAAMCGACVEVARDNGQTVMATVVDQCPVGTNPKCTAGHIDLSKAAFLQVGTEIEGYLGTGNNGSVGVISWRYAPCPSVGNVTVRYKEASNIFWNEFIVENHVNPIAKFEVLLSGAYVAAERKIYNYFAANGGDLTVPDWPLVVRITDINGSVIEGALPMPTGVPRVDLGVQFPACTQ